jgi:hypothetical protein
MYMNPWETQSVRSLDVKIGGQSVPAEPMQMMRSALSQRREDMPQAVPMSAGADMADEAPKCPFAEVVATAFNEAQTAATPSNDSPVWTVEAEKRVAERIPSFVLPMARMGIEKYARERGYRDITPAVLDEAKDIFMG